MVKEATLLKPEQLGGIAFNADIGTGICEVTLTAPFGLQTMKVKVPLIDIMESAAHINVTLYAMQREMAKRMHLGGKGA